MYGPLHHAAAANSYLGDNSRPDGEKSSCSHPYPEGKTTGCVAILADVPVVVDISPRFTSVTQYCEQEGTPTAMGQALAETVPTGQETGRRLPAAVC